MSQSTEQVWYYSQDGRERGPVPVARLKELAAAGTVKPTDLVWREGMDDWVPATRVEGLFPATSPSTAASGPPAPPAPRPGSPPSSAKATASQALDRAQSAVSGALADLARPGSRSAKLLLIVGIVLVILARGCSQLDDRNGTRLAAKLQSAKFDFEQEWNLKGLEIQQKINALQDKETRSTDDNKKLEELRKEFRELQTDRNEKRDELALERWRDLEIAASHARFSADMWAYWYEMFFVLGAMAFTVGLILVGFGSPGPEKWLALAMLAILVYSIFVSGSAW